MTTNATDSHPAIVASAGAELTILAGWINEQLGDETADRRWIAESAAAKVRDITLQMLGAAELARRAIEYRPEGDTPSHYRDWAFGLRKRSASSSSSCPARPSRPAPLTPGWHSTMRQALADAIRYCQERASEPCAECDALPGPDLCPAHEDCPGQIGMYRALARELGIEVSQ